MSSSGEAIPGGDDFDAIVADFDKVSVDANESLTAQEAYEKWLAEETDVVSIEVAGYSLDTVMHFARAGVELTNLFSRHRVGDNDEVKLSLDFTLRPDSPLNNCFSGLELPNFERFFAFLGEAALLDEAEFEERWGHELLF